jgi:hypothetical protein
MVNLKEIIDEVFRHLEVFLQSTGSQPRPASCACAKATAKERGIYAAMRRYYHNILFPGINKTAMQKPAIQTCLL